MIKRKFVAAAMSLGLSVTAVPAGIYAEEVTTEEQTVEEGTAEEETAAEEEAFDFSAAYDEKGFFRDVKALDYVTLPDYSVVEILDTDVIPGDDAIQEQIDYVLSSYTTTENVTEGTIEDGTTVNIDYVGSIDGVEFEGGSTGGAGTDVTIGVTNYIDGFLDQLIGHAPGESFDINVTFPEDYQNTDLAGKDAVFAITVNHIVETIVPEFNDDFVKENLNYNTAADYRQYIYDTIYDSNLRNAVLSWLVANAEISEVPAVATDATYNYEYEYLNSMVYYYGMTVEDYLAYMGMTTDDMRTQCEAYAGQVVILQALMEDAGLEVTADLALEITGGDPDAYAQYVEFYGENYIYNAALPDCVANFLKDAVEFVEAEIESESETEEAAEETEAE